MNIISNNPDSFSKYIKPTELNDRLLPMAINRQVAIDEVENELGMVMEEGGKYG